MLHIFIPKTNSLRMCYLDSILVFPPKYINVFLNHSGTGGVPYNEKDRSTIGIDCLSCYVKSRPELHMTILICSSGSRLLICGLTFGR